MTTPADLIDRLASDDVATQRAAADEICGLGAAAVSPLIEAIRCLEPTRQRWMLCKTLASLGRVAYAPVRDALLGARTDQEHAAFAAVFPCIGESALPDYIAALQDPHREIRRLSVQGIRGLKKELRLPAAPALVALLGDADEQMSQAAAWALGDIGPAVIPMLQEIRATGTLRARHAALSCLADAGGETALSDRDRKALGRLLRVKLAHDVPVGISCCFLSWIAVESSDQQGVMDFCGLTPTWPATFRLGNSAADSDGHFRDDERRFARVFVTPPLGGWTLMFGPWCNPLQRRESTLELCLRASATFGKAQAYWFADQGDGSAWLIAENGTLIRRAAYPGDPPDNQFALGSPLPEEEEVLAAAPEDERPDALYDFAPLLAGRRSLNPHELKNVTPEQGHGWLALTPIGVAQGTPPGALEL